MKTPFFLIDNGDVSAFSSGQELEKYVESPDIGDYLVFDTSGRKFELQSAQKRAGAIVDIDRVQLIRSNEAPQPHLLRGILSSFLEKLNVPILTDDDLPELVRLLVKTIGYTR